ncbi:hypothetical protein [Azorhizobium sp. AG788]|uniref:hypothetical protein n=1 Tax=Azorhizobium sp. AG788 TaxID=2183897 RepID=UPI0031387C81
MTVYYRKNVVDLPHDVGVDQADGSRSSDGSPGYLSFGPYLALSPGTYFGGFHVRKTAPCAHTVALDVDASCKGGSVIVGKRSVSGDEILTDIAGLVGFSFDLTEPEDRFELRLHVSPGARVNVRDVVIFRLKPTAS